jgi:hypothetical protein
MNRTLSFFTALVAASALSGGCGFERQSTPLEPTPATATDPGPGVPYNPQQPWVGVWASAPLIGLPNPATCGNLAWTVTSQTGTSLAGNFSAVCGGNTTISGSASGHINGYQIPMQASGKASAPGVPSCDFSLTGTGYVEDPDTIRIEYSGTFCSANVSGVERVRRRLPIPAPAPTNPAPAPTPTPPPNHPAPPPGDPLFGCGSIQDKQRLVDCIHAGVNPSRTVEGAFEVTKRVAWALRGEGAGLLIKNGGENIISWQGYSFSASRICYPDGHIYKVLTDVPATNGPSWQDNDFVDPKLYVPAIDPTR